MKEKMTRKTSRDRGTTGRRKGIVLAEDACPSCGTAMREKRGKLTLPVNGEEVTVRDASHLRCPRCAEAVLRFDEVRQLRQRAFEIYRKKYGLLSVEEIRSLRERLDLTQAALARLLRLGSNTISRWEAGRNVQTASLDVLLRLIRDLPGSIEYLRRHAA